MILSFQLTRVMCSVYTNLFSIAVSIYVILIYYEKMINSKVISSLAEAVALHIAFIVTVAASILAFYSKIMQRQQSNLVNEYIWKSWWRTRKGIEGQQIVARQIINYLLFIANSFIWKNPFDPGKKSVVFMERVNLFSKTGPWAISGVTGGVQVLRAHHPEKKLPQLKQYFLMKVMHLHQEFKRQQT